LGSPLQIPDWIWIKRFYQGGQVRLPKKKKWYDQNNRVSVWKPAHAHGPMQPYMLKKESVSTGDLRYWLGDEHPNVAHVGMCRNCKQVAINKKERAEHLAKGCGAILEAAYKKLKRSHECVVCNGSTTHKMWGLPLCNKECEFEWMYKTHQPTILSDLIRQIIDEGKEELSAL
jgi:hypothetical protein